MHIRKEAIVFVGTEPQKLRYTPSCVETLLLRGPTVSPMVFIQGSDYVIDLETGTIRRTEQSRIPDWREHPLFGLEHFDHRGVGSVDNSAYTCILDYETGEQGRALPSRRELLPRLHEKLKEGETVRYVVYGDSISAGYEASKPIYAYAELFAASLRAAYPATEIHVHNKAIGGENSHGGVKRLHEDVIALQPDLITIAYGMNDQNRNPDGSNATPIAAFERNLTMMIDGIRNHTAADIILITPCLPNPRWMFASSNVTEYADAIRRLGAARGVPVADVQQRWEEDLAAGKSHESLLLNNLNHPNDYGHKLYAEVLSSYI